MGACCCKEEEIDFDAEVELSHFHLLRSVGKGAFGKVRVVQHKHTKVLYALKYINKAKCIKMRAVENIIQERRLLEEIDYPLVCNLRYAFQDDENLFMVLDLMLGGDLRFHLERYGQMSEDVVRFYVAEVSLGLAYLHSKRIVHRDLKPDNVLLDDKGHAHLTDFNIAVHCHEKKPLMSVAGSMAYMAPEVLTKKGYYESVDWWSLGVVMYELLFSKRPFRGKTNSALTQAILHEPLVFPDNVRETVSDDCMDVIRRFCERDVSKRLGCGPHGLEDIKCHPWFRDVEWDKLDTKEARAPFVPDSKKANFDATHELEELLLEDNPLKAKKRNANQDINELSKEMRMMEEKFLIYDFTKMRRRSYFTNNLGMEMASSQRRGSRNLRPQLTPLPLPETETAEPTAAGIEEIRDDVEAKLNGEWLNERPVSPANREQRRRSAFLGSFGGSGRASPIVAAAHDSDYFLAKPHSHTSSRTPSPNTISPQEQIRSPSSIPILTQAAMTSLTPPPRVQSPTPKTHSISSASSRPTSPLESDSSTPNQPSMRYANPSSHLLTRSNGSLRRLSAVASPAGAAEAAPLSSAPLLPPQGPPPNGPLPPPPMTVKTTETTTTTTTTTTMTTTTTTTTLPISSACASATDGSFGPSNSFKLYTLSPSTAKRSTLTSDEPSSLMPGADFADQPPTTNTFFTASTGTALTLQSGASEVSLATTVSMSSNEFHQSFSPYVGDVPSAVSSALGRVPSNGSHSHRRLSRSSLTSNGHYRSASEVSSVEHGALSAVGVPAGV